MKILLDTHILLHAAAGALASARNQLLHRKENQILFSVISLWEITKLHQLKRFRAEGGLELLLRKFTTHPRYLEIGLTVDVLMQVTSIADKMHRDPADHIIVATALVEGARLVTDDDAIKASGLVDVL